MLLYPDQRVEQPDNDTCCFAAPIEKCDWEHLAARGHVLKQTGMRFLILADESADQVEFGVDYCSVYFMRNDSEWADRVCLLLRDDEDEDTCLESAAWIRIQENYPGMIYVARGSATADKWQTHAAIAGVDDTYVCMVDIGVIEGEDK